MRVTDPELLAQLNAPTKVTDPEILAQLNGQQEKPMSWGEAVSSGLKRFPESAGKMVYETVANLPQAPQNLLNLGNAAIQKVMPESVNRFMHDVAPDTAKNPEILSNIANFYKDRYNSEEGFKKALANDPAGVLSDVSTIATGGGALMSKVPQLAKAGAIVSKAGAITNPLALPQAAISKAAGVASPVIGMTTGIGSDALKDLYKAGASGGEQLASALRNMRTPSGNYKDLVTNAREALTNLQRQRGAEYQAGMEGINANKNVLEFDPVVESIKSTIEKHQFKGRPSGSDAAKTQQALLEKVDEWQNLDPSEFHTAQGFDWLKREIGDIGESTEQGSSARKVADEAYNAVKNQIVQQDKSYADVMKKYSEASDLLHELTGTFSLGEKARTDTAVRKLQQALRNNANTNWGYRGDLMNELEKAGATNLRPSVAGQAASSWTPRGLQGASASTLAALATQNPALALGLPFQSPRLMGEGAVLAGKASNLIPNIDPKLLAQYLYQSNQPKEVQ